MAGSMTRMAPTGGQLFGLLVHEVVSLLALSALLHLFFCRSCAPDGGNACLGSIRCSCTASGLGGDQEPAGPEAAVSSMQVNLVGLI